VYIDLIGVAQRPLQDGEGQGGSFYLGPGDAAFSSNTPHDTCSISVVEKDGRMAVEQRAVFSIH